MRFDEVVSLKTDIEKRMLICGCGSIGSIYDGGMRAGNRFEDLEQQFAHDQQQQRLAQAKELELAEKTAISLNERLHWALGSKIVATTVGGRAYEGKLAASGKDWIELFSLQNQVKVLLPLENLLWQKGALEKHPESRKPQTVPLPLLSKLEQIRDSRKSVTLHLADRELQCRILAVWKDHLEIGFEQDIRNQVFEAVNLRYQHLEALVGNWD